MKHDLKEDMKCIQAFVPDLLENSVDFKYYYDQITTFIGPYNEDVTDVLILFEKGSLDKYILPFLDDIQLFLKGAFYTLRNREIKLQYGKCTFEQFMNAQKKIAAESDDYRVLWC